MDEIISNLSQTNGLAYFSLAAIFFHHHRYSDCQRIIEALFSTIEYLDEPLSFNVCFLRLEVMVRMAHVVGSLDIDGFRLKFWNKFIATFTYLETLKVKMEGTETSEDDKDAMKSWISFKKHMYRCKCLIEMNQIKQSKKEIKNALEIFQREIRLPDSQQSFQKYDISAVGKAYFGCPLSSSDNQNQLALCLKVKFCHHHLSHYRYYKPKSFS